MKYKTEWDLEHIYKGDPKKQVARDCAVLKKEYSAFAKNYRKNKRHLKNAKALAKAIADYEKLVKNPAGERPGAYYSYRLSLNSQDDEARSEVAKLSEFFADLANEIEFFTIEIGKTGKGAQKKFLKSKELAPFRYFLKKLFENAKYDLSEAEEKILNLKSAPAHGMWISGSSKLLNKQAINFEGKEIPIAEAFAMIPALATEKRRALHKEIMKVLKGISDFSESEMNAVITDKKINDKLRGFKFPFEATVRGYENNLMTVKNLVETVSRNFPIAHKFYEIKAKMLGEKELSYADRAARVGEVKMKISFESAAERVKKLFGDADPDFGNFVEEMMRNGFVDVFPRKNKSGGAFCSSGSGMPTYILLNHVNDFNSLTTLAHEMGHGIHAKYSKTQRPLYDGHTIATAEVASTFFENMVFDEALKDIAPEKRMILLHDKISDDISTIFRQIACFNFENELHLKIRRDGFLPKEKIAELLNKHMQSYLGPAFKLAEEDGYFFVSWPHIRSFFYVYSYAFGQLISNALYEEYKKDKGKIKDVIRFLSAGASDSPENIFRKVGINPDKKLFEAGLKRIKSNIDELEKLLGSKNK